MPQAPVTKSGSSSIWPSGFSEEYKKNVIVYGQRRQTQSDDNTSHDPLAHMNLICFFILIRIFIPLNLWLLWQSLRLYISKYYTINRWNPLTRGNFHFWCAFLCISEYYIHTMETVIEWEISNLVRTTHSVITFIFVCSYSKIGNPNNIMLLGVCLPKDLHLKSTKVTCVPMPMFGLFVVELY